MTLFDEFINDVIATEGGYVDDPSDSGGETKYGVTKGVARDFGYENSMAALPLSFAKQIYKEKYWDELLLDDIELLCPSIVKELLDTGINQGVSRAGKYLQKVLNSLNGDETCSDDLTVDGHVGPATIRSLKALIRRRGPKGELVLLRGLNCLQGAHYIELSHKRPKDKKFVFGWILNRVVI